MLYAAQTTTLEDKQYKPLIFESLLIMRQTNKPHEELLADLSELYLRYIRIQPDTDKKTNVAFFDAFADYLDNKPIEQISSMLESKQWIVNQVKDKAQNLYLFKQPVVLIIYCLLDTKQLNPKKIQEVWPLPAYYPDLESIFSDLDIRPRIPLF